MDSLDPNAVNMLGRVYALFILAIDPSCPLLSMFPFCLSVKIPCPRCDGVRVRPRAAAVQWSVMLPQGSSTMQWLRTMIHVLT